MSFQVKEDNSEIATMERQIHEAQDEMNRLLEDLNDLESVRKFFSNNFIRMSKVIYVQVDSIGMGVLLTARSLVLFSLRFPDMF